MADLNGKRIAILATHGFEQSELTVPRDRLREMGAEVQVISPEEGPIRGWKGSDWGESAEVDRRRRPFRDTTSWTRKNTRDFLLAAKIS